MNRSSLQPLSYQEPNIPNRQWGIFLISILSLFLETLFIRWIGTEIRIFSYLQNTILIVCFLGLGIGMFTSSRPVEMKQSLVPLTVLLFLMAIPITREALGSTSEMLSTLGDLVIWSRYEARDLNNQILLLLAGLALTYGVLALIIDTFVPLGRILGRLMNASPNPIWAYSINILGSILGTWLFVVLSYFYQPPFVWFLITAALLAWFVFWSSRDRNLNYALLGAIVALAWFASQVPGAIDIIWSPYQKLLVREGRTNWLGNYEIDVNNVGYQVILDLREKHVSAQPDRFPPELKGLSQYDIPFLLHPDPASVLLVGAGAGNDAAGALRHNVQVVTAVEIDPAIIRIGEKLHPEEPYSSSRVQVIDDDARSFFATTREKYDVISFGLLDSHTTTALTNARLDHYVYTRESILQAKSKLNEGGIMVLSFEAQRPFIADRIQRVLREAFEKPPLIFRIPASEYGVGGVMFVTGDLGTVQRQLDRNDRLATYIKQLQTTSPIELTNTTKVTTDDWPYLYLESPQIPVLYYLLILVISILFIRTYRRWQAKRDLVLESRSFWHFGLLGAAFLLLEVQNISKASVALGNTWQVNAVIISSILGMALLANLIAYRFPKLPAKPVYVLLIATAIGLYFVDLATFAFLPYLLKAMVIGVLTSLPMLFSGIVFVRSFEVASDKSSALGANLIGGLVGALLQSITFVIGIKALLLIVAGFYLLSFLTAPASDQTQDQLLPQYTK